MREEGIFDTFIQHVHSGVANINCVGFHGGQLRVKKLCDMEIIKTCYGNILRHPKPHSVNGFDDHSSIVVDGAHDGIRAFLCAQQGLNIIRNMVVIRYTLIALDQRTDPFRT